MFYDRFTDRARTALNLARQEAVRFNHEYLGPEHILLGLVQEGSGIGATVLKSMGIDLPTIRTEVERIVKRGPPMVVEGALPFTQRAQRVLALSTEESDNLGHNYIGTEHLLLGLIKENEGIPALVLLNLGVTLEDARTRVMDFTTSIATSPGASEDEEPTTELARHGLCPKCGEHLERRHTTGKHTFEHAGIHGGGHEIKHGHPLFGLAVWAITIIGRQFIEDDKHYHYCTKCQYTTR